jgi:hypothetical protein
VVSPNPGTPESRTSCPIRLSTSDRGFSELSGAAGGPVGPAAIATDNLYPETATVWSADVPEMLELVRMTDPGPFFERTIEFGKYLGIRRDGALVARASQP